MKINELFNVSGKVAVVTGGSRGIGEMISAGFLANGVKVLGVDPDPSKCELAESIGISTLSLSPDSDPVLWCLARTEGIGIDGAIITAATSSNEPINIAAKSCRKRGRIILIGVTGLLLSRELFYKKELSFQVSCSYGPGRYDKSYEELSQDYPIGFVRWTEGRNFKAVLDTFSRNNIQPSKYITHRFSIDKAEDAYSLLMSKESSIGILLKYQSEKQINRSLTLKNSFKNQTEVKFQSDIPVISFIGAGNYAKKTLIPAFLKTGASLDSIVSSSGLLPLHLGRKFGFNKISTDINQILSDDNCNAVVIATRHDSHAEIVHKALKANKHVFVEKPLCLNRNELSLIKKSYKGNKLLMVGFNRRFSPLILKIKNKLTDIKGPKTFIYTCNAGYIPNDHWTNDPKLGGGRLIGEACHFVDLIGFLCDSEISEIKSFHLKECKNLSDTFTIQLSFEDGSIGTINYFSNGNSGFPKERLEIFFSGKIISLDNYRKIKTWGLPELNNIRNLKQDKGQGGCAKAFIDAIKSGDFSPIPFNEICHVHEKLFEVMEAK